MRRVRIAIALWVLWPVVGTSLGLVVYATSSHDQVTSFCAFVTFVAGVGAVLSLLWLVYIANAAFDTSTSGFNRQRFHKKIRQAFVVPMAALFCGTVIWLGADRDGTRLLASLIVVSSIGGIISISYYFVVARIFVDAITFRTRLHVP